MSYPKEVDAFIRNNVAGHTARELAEMTNARFGTEFTEQKMHCYKSNHKIHSVKKERDPWNPTDRYPERVMQYIRKNYKGCGPKEMAKRMNKELGTDYSARQIKAFYENRSLDSGITGYFEKGTIPPNKGKKGYCHPAAVPTQFKKGNVPVNKFPVGTVKKKTDGYIWKKIGEGEREWKQLHRILWEEANGPIPEGHVLIFKNGNKEDVRLENLILVTLEENAVMNRCNLRSRVPELTETGTLIAKIKIEQRKRK